MLLNFETLLIKEFGEVAALGERLTVPLQLSGFRSEVGLRSLKLAQSQLPTDIMDFLCRHRAEVCWPPRSMNTVTTPSVETRGGRVGTPAPRCRSDL